MIGGEPIDVHGQRLKGTRLCGRNRIGA